MRAIRVTSERSVLATTAGDDPGRHRAQLLLTTSGGGRIPSPTDAPERRNEHQALIGRGIP
jgi:hypothetical protein